MPFLATEVLEIQIDVLHGYSMFLDAIATATAGLACPAAVAAAAAAAVAGKTREKRGPVCARGLLALLPLLACWLNAVLFLRSLLSAHCRKMSRAKGPGKAVVNQTVGSRESPARIVAGRPSELASKVVGSPSKVFNFE